jgi:hypothetical protein
MLRVLEVGKVKLRQNLKDQDLGLLVPRRQAGLVEGRKAIQSLRPFDFAQGFTPAFGRAEPIHRARGAR